MIVTCVNVMHNQYPGDLGGVSIAAILRSMRLRSTLVALVVFGAMAVTPSGNASDLQLVSQRQVSERLTELTFRTPALTHLIAVRVLMPSEVEAGRRYPALYLLHGGGAGDQGVDDWTTTNGGGDAEDLTKDLPLITVMPGGGASAWYADYYNNGLGGTPMWETFHIDQLIPWIDAHYPTIASVHGRAIAGLSSGGFGAMSYAARNPDLFSAVAAFSGAVDTNTRGSQRRTSSTGWSPSSRTVRRGHSSACGRTRRSGGGGTTRGTLPRTCAAT